MAQRTFTVADYLLTRLKQLGVGHVFQIPGDYVKNFTQALEHFEGIETIGAINELDAAYAADAYARTRGLAAVSLQFGVSTFSALNAIAGAWVERSPIVVVSATPGSDARIRSPPSPRRSRPIQSHGPATMIRCIAIGQSSSPTTGSSSIA